MPDREITREQMNQLLDVIAFKGQGKELVHQDNAVMRTGSYRLDNEPVIFYSPDAADIDSAREAKLRYGRASQTHAIAAMQRARLRIFYSNALSRQIDNIIGLEPDPDDI